MWADAPNWLVEWAATRSRDERASNTARLDLGERPAWLRVEGITDPTERALAQLSDTEWTPATEAQLRSALAFIPAIDRDVWLRAGMALHTSGWPNAFEIWDAWSRTSTEKYNEADQHWTWNSFRGSRNGKSVTLRTIFHSAREHGWTEDRVSNDAGAAPGNDQAGAAPNGGDEGAPHSQRDPMMTAAELRKLRFEPVRYVLPGLIPEGLALLVGRPKIGKSWFALDVCISASDNRPTLGSLMAEHGDVLYLALEDNWRRLQRRLDKLIDTFRGEWPVRLTLVSLGGWPRADQGGLAKIEEWCKAGANPVLVVIDTLERFRKPANGKAPLYSTDYEAITGLQKIAATYGIAIVVLHHDRKSDADDAFDTVSGTLGLTGAADTILMIKRGRNGVILYARGRDIEDSETAMQFDKATCRWLILGKASEVQRSNERAKVIAALKAAGQSLSTKEIMVETETPNRNAMDILLGKMVRDGEIARVGRGRYDLSDKNKGQNGQKERSSG